MVMRAKEQEGAKGTNEKRVRTQKNRTSEGKGYNLITIAKIMYW